MIVSLLCLASACASVDGDAMRALAAPAAPVARSDEEPGPRSFDLSVVMLNAAARALADGNHERAATLLERLVERTPDDPTAWFLLGAARLGQDRLSESREHLRRADALQPHDPATLSLLARLAFDLEGPEPAAVLLEQVVLLDPDDAGHWTNLGLVRLELNRFNDAHDAFLLALENDPDLAGAHRGLGRLYGAVGEIQLAERAWRTALELDPGDPLAWLSLGHVLRDQAQSGQALAAYEGAQSLLPNDPWVAANRGSLLLDLARPQEAKGPLLAAVAGLAGRGRDEQLALLDYARCLSVTGDLDGAEDALGLVLEQDPDNLRGRAQLGALLLDRQRDAEAREQLAQAAELGLLAPDLQLELVLLHERSGASSDARRSALTLLEPSDDPAWLVQRARLQLMSRDPELHDAAAAEGVLLPLLSGPLRDHAAGWALLAQALAERGALAEAVDALDAALAADSDAPGRMSWRARRERLSQRIEQR